MTNPDHDSMFLRFERLEKYLREIGEYTMQHDVNPTIRQYACDAQIIARLLREQALK